MTVFEPNALPPQAQKLVDVRCPTCKNILLRVGVESRSFTFEIKCRHCSRIFRAEIGAMDAKTHSGKQIVREDAR